jgi:uncharacterized protein with HEPN domain
MHAPCDTRRRVPYQGYLEAISNVEEFVADRRNMWQKVYQKAVLHELGALGEAIVHLSSSFKSAHSQVPWEQIVELRNKLVHECWSNAWANMEAIVDENLPVLKSVVSEGLQPPSEEVGPDKSLADVAKQPPMATPQVPASKQSKACGAWMPIARARCVLLPGHVGHHRSDL